MEGMIMGISADYAASLLLSHFLCAALFMTSSADYNYYNFFWKPNFY